MQSSQCARPALLLQRSEARQGGGAGRGGPHQVSNSLESFGRNSVWSLKVSPGQCATGEKITGRERAASSNTLGHEQRCPSLGAGGQWHAARWGHRQRRCSQKLLTMFWAKRSLNCLPAWPCTFLQIESSRYLRPCARARPPGIQICARARTRLAQCGRRQRQAKRAIWAASRRLAPAAAWRETRESAPWRRSIPRGARGTAHARCGWLAR